MNNMADNTNLKSWLVKKFFSIPDWYVLSETEEGRLFDLIIREQPSSFAQAHFIRMLDCSAFCTIYDCYFCSNLSKLCSSCVSCPSASRD